MVNDTVIGVTIFMFLFSGDKGEFKYNYIITKNTHCIVTICVQEMWITYDASSLLLLYCYCYFKQLRNSVIIVRYD